MKDNLMDNEMKDEKNKDNKLASKIIEVTRYWIKYPSVEMDLLVLATSFTRSPLALDVFCLLCTINLSNFFPQQ
jgi:hypothetical protein